MFNPPARKRLLILIVVSILLIAGAFAIRRTSQSGATREKTKFEKASDAELLAAAKADPTNARIFYYLGIHARDKQKAEAAWRTLQMALKLDPDDEDIVIAAANSSSAIGNDAEAFDTLKAFIGRHPKSGQAHLALSVLYHTNTGNVAAYREAKEAVQWSPRDSKAWRMLGTAALFANRESESEPAFMKAIELEPRDWRSEFGLGNTLHILRRDEEATVHYKRALSLSPPEAEAGIVMAMGRAQLGAAGDTASINEAVQTLERAVALTPNSALNHMALGEGYMRLQRWRDAEKMVLFAEKKLPDLPEVHGDMLRIYQRLGNSAGAQRESELQKTTGEYKSRTEDLASQSDQKGQLMTKGLELARLYRDHPDIPNALKWYTKLQKFAPDNVTVAKELAALERSHPELAEPQSDSGGESHAAEIVPILKDADDLLSQNKFADAERLYRNAVGIDPKSALALQGLAAALYGLKNQNEAFAMANRAVSIDPTLPEAQFTLAQIYFRTGLQDEAAHRLTLLVQQYPNEPKYVHALGSCYSTNSLRYTEAEKWLKRTVELLPDNAEYLCDLADVQAKLQKNAVADRNYRQAARLAPDDPIVISHFAEFLIDHNPTAADAALADELLRKSRSMIPNDPAALLSLGRLNALRNNHKAAIDSLEAAVAMNPNLSAAWYDLSREYQKAGNLARAAECRKNFTRVTESSDVVSKVEEQTRLHLKDPLAILKLARVYAKYGYAAKAINQYEYSLYLDKTNTSAKKEMDGYEASLKARHQMPDMSTFNAMLDAATLKKSH